MVDATALVGTGTLVEVLPAGIVMVEGGTAAVELLERLTTAPPAGACPLSITNRTVCCPPLIVPGDSVTDFSEGGSTVNGAEAEPPFKDAVMVTGVDAATCATWT